ncbi:MAG TPA: metalloregulator ArsR/SmtB family transcription factor [Longimicrobium sp.]|nr:metalloregulator ArsR/SmtB family transcription factor [Longimicrobium sp.]
MSTTTAADLARTARLFHALSDETRLRIVQMLQGGEHCVCDLTGALDAAQSRLSFHLKTLREAGLVSDRRMGRWVYYSLVPGALEEVGELAVALRPVEQPWRAQGEGCCR